MDQSTDRSQTDMTSPKRGETSGRGRSPSVRPPVDIFEDSHGIKVIADLPGVSKQALDVRVHDNNLYIEAVSAPATTSDLKVHHAELRTARFSRSFSLSADFDPSRIDASLKDGVLTVIIPRREEAKPRRIEVQVQ